MGSAWACVKGERTKRIQAESGALFSHKEYNLPPAENQMEGTMLRETGQTQEGGFLKKQTGDWKKTVWFPEGEKHQKWEEKGVT